jgi:hypothetical protein
MAIDSVSSSSESVPNQEQVSVVREDDGSLSISICAGASATARANGESSSDSTTGAEQARSSMDGTDTDYPTDQAGVGDDTAGTHDEALVTTMEDLLATIDETIELLGGQSGDGMADRAQSIGGDAPVDNSQIDTVGSEDTELAERLDRMVTDLEQLAGELSGAETGEGTSDKTPEDQFIFKYINLTSEGPAEVIEMLESGEFGDAGKEIAKLLPNIWDIDGDMWNFNNDVKAEIKAIMAENPGLAEELLTAIEPIYEEHQERPVAPPVDGAAPTNYSQTTPGNRGSIEPSVPGDTNIGEQFVDLYRNDLTIPEGRMEIIDVLASGEFGDDGKKIAELLPNMIGVNGEEFWGEEAYLEIKEIMLESEEAEEILAALESISK